MQKSTKKIIFGLNLFPRDNYSCTEQVKHKYQISTIQWTAAAAGVQASVCFLNRMSSLNSVCGYFRIQSLQVQLFVVSRHDTVTFQCSKNWGCLSLSASVPRLWQRQEYGSSYNWWLFQFYHQEERGVPLCVGVTNKNILLSQSLFEMLNKCRAALFFFKFARGLLFKIMSCSKVLRTSFRTCST